MSFKQRMNLWVIVALIATSGCVMRDPALVKIDAAFSKTADPGNSFGGLVPGKPGDPFHIYAAVSTAWAQRWNQGDTFLAAVDVGAAGNPTKYGSVGGVRFKLDTNWNFWVVNAVINQVLPNPLGNRRYYFARTVDPLKIWCNDQNKLVFSVPGASSDSIRIRTRTAGMAGTAATRVKYDSFWGSNSKRFRCALKEPSEVPASD